MEPTQPKSCEGCPLYGVASGFVLGAGSPETAKYAVILEAPGRQEISFTLTPNPKRAFLQTQEECDRELAVRKRDYPNLTNGFIRTGLPVCGPTGLALQFWLWQKIGIKREECYIDNTLRCLPPKGKSGAAYPTGEARKQAEQYCRQYDRIDKFRPDCAVISMHPAALVREITPLPLVSKDWERVRDFTAAGRRVMMLLGGKAAHAFARCGEAVQRWRGHYFELAADWTERYKSQFEFARKAKVKRTAVIAQRPTEMIPARQEY